MKPLTLKGLLPVPPISITMPKLTTLFTSNKTCPEPATALTSEAPHLLSALLLGGLIPLVALCFRETLPRAERVRFRPREPGVGFLRLFRNGRTLRGLVSNANHSAKRLVSTQRL